MSRLGSAAGVARARSFTIGSVGAALVGALAAGCGGAPPPAASGHGPPGGARIDPPAAVGALAPNLTAAAGDLFLSWLEPLPGDRHRLLVSRLDGDGWEPPAVVAEGEGFFANWADLPAVARAGDGSLIAHWLAKTGEATYAYSVFLARSTDGGRRWTAMGRLNDDDTPTEHGFVSWVPEGDGLRAFWLDGREMPGGGAMGLRTARVGETVGASEVLDPRVCECCSTTAAGSGGGALVAYRDRGDDETRDISVVRARPAGWTAPQRVAADGWIIAGCPVNGPAVDVGGPTAAIAWFTAAGDAPQVLAALSDDGGDSFGPPLTVDAAAPLGRVDLVLDARGGAVVGWMAAADGVGSVRLRRLGPGGVLAEPVAIATTGASRASGFPRLARLAGILYVAWVDTTAPQGQRIRAQAIALDQLPSGV